MQIAKKILVSGKVQNVGFRYYTKKKAEELNICGFVKNELDGSVYIEAMGEETELDLFVHWCNSGPHWARVEKVKNQEIPLFDENSFNVK